MNIRFIIVVLLCSVSYCSKAIIYRHDMPLSSFTELAKKTAFNCVGLIYNVSTDTNSLAGSCVLIDGRYVLTAWHVFNSATGFRQENYKVAFNGILYNIENYVSTLGEGHDMVALRLAEEVTGIIPAIITDEVIALPGDTVTMVGYGSQRPSDVLNGRDGIGIKTAAQNIIDSVGGASINYMSSCLYADFDGPMSEQNNPLPLEGLLNGGDSGGGMFVFKNGKYYLAGIAKGTRMQLSSTTGYDGSTMHWSSISSYYSWISYAIISMEDN